jgi:hypothetical protein
LIELFLGHPLRVIVGASESSRGVDEHDRRRPLRMRGREQKTAGHAQSQLRYVFATDLIEHGQHVIEHAFG